MLSENLLKQLNEQMNFEFYSSRAYLAMGSYCADESWEGFANFFLVQAEEERYHAMKIFNFIHSVGKRAEISDLQEPNNTFTSVLDCFEQAYRHEQEVSRRIYALSDMALNEREHATLSLLQWFVDEQVEEEDMFDSIIQKLKRIDHDSNAMLMLDAEFKERQFTPEA